MGACDDGPHVSRRTLLQVSGGAVGLLGMGRARAAGTDQVDKPAACPDATLRPRTVQYGAHENGGCADEHPETRALQQEVADALEASFPTVGALIDDGFLPYFDFMTANEGSGVSHWLNPEYIGDDAMLDPARPESVLVDHRWWRPLGTMFVATVDGQEVEEPPAIYTEESAGAACLPWHAHVGLPGRYAWWKYRLLYTDGFEAGMRDLPCRTPWLTHVWAYDHPESIYAHAAPPRDARGGPPAEPAGFETDAVPGKDELSWEVLPDVVKRRVHHR